MEFKGFTGWCGLVFRNSPRPAASSRCFQERKERLGIIVRIFKVDHHPKSVLEKTDRPMQIGGGFVKEGRMEFDDVC